MSRKDFWTSVPGVLTGFAALITATTGVYLALHRPVEPEDPAGDHLPAPAPAATLSTPTVPKESATSGAADTVMATVSNWPLVAMDTFSSPTAQWTVGSYPNEYSERFDLAFVGGKYRWDLAFSQDWLRNVSSPYGSVVDFYAAVDLAVSKWSGRYFDVGLMFGRSGNRDYKFILSHNRYFCVTRARDIDNDVVLDWLPIQVTFDRPTKIAVFVDGGRMAFLVNDNLVATYRDDAFSGGGVGLFFGGAADTAGVVEFDNFELRSKPIS